MIAQDELEHSKLRASMGALTGTKTGKLFAHTIPSINASAERQCGPPLIKEERRPDTKLLRRFARTCACGLPIACLGRETCFECYVIQQTGHSWPLYVEQE